MENGGDGIEAFNKAHDLIQQGLLACLDHERGAGIAENLNLVYEWSLREILAARLDRNLERLDQVMGVLADLREAWSHMSSRGEESNAAIEVTKSLN
jgi:flagellar protein FliS